MKKIYLSGLAVLALSMAACSNEDEQFFNENTQEVFSGEIITAESRTELGEGGKILWSDGDAINLFKKTGYYQKYVVKESGAVSADFVYGGVNVMGTTLTQHYAAYPYAEGNTVEGTTLKLNLSSLAEQTYTENSFDATDAVMVAKSNSTALPFTNALSMARVNLSIGGAVVNATVSSVKFVSTDKSLTGTATVDMSKERQPAIITGDGKEIVLTANNVALSAEPTPFYVMMPVGEYANKTLKLVINAVLNGEQKVWTKEYDEVINFQRSMIETFTVQFTDDNEWSGSTDAIIVPVENAEKANEALATNSGVKIADATGTTETEPITIPAKEAAAEVGHVIDLSAATMPTNAPVYIAVSEGDASTTNTVENLEVIVPVGTTSQSLNINAPGTTVTVTTADGTVIDVIEASTAQNTLIINNGVTVNKLIIKQGNVRIEKGATVREIVNESNETIYVYWEGEVPATPNKDPKIIYMSNDEALVACSEQFKAALDNNAITTIKLIENFELNETLVINHSVTLYGNEKMLNYTGTDRLFQITGGSVVINDLTINMSENTPEGSRGINLYNGVTNAAINVTLNNVTVNGNKAYAVNIGGGKDNKLSINNSTLTGYAAINVAKESVNHTIVVDGSTLNGKNQNNNYHFGTVVVDGANKNSLTITNSNVTKENLEGITSEYYQVVVGANCTYNVCEGINVAVRNVFNETDGLYYIGLKGAVNKGGNIKLLADIELEDMIEIPSGKTVTLDLNGKTITGTDKTTKNFSVIDNRGNLTIKNSATSEGKLTLKATTNSGWNRYSAVLANNPGGNLTVKEGVIIEHLGGTDMAYGIDNLTNGKGTTAVTTIDGATIKSPYRAIRQFLNGVEATNELYVKSGIIEGTNKSIWMQDPSKNANTGKLVVDKNAQLKGDAYLYVTPGSTEWPVEVSIAKTALGESEVVTGNVPEGYIVVLNNGNYVVKTVVTKEASTLEELKEALEEAGSAGAGYTTINITADIDMKGTEWTPIKVDGYHGADIVTVEGNNHTIKGLTGGLFAGGFAGGSGIVIKNLTIANSTIIANNTQGYGAFVGCADSMEEITLINCHLKSSTIITPNDGAAESRIGGLIGWTAGYNNQNDGPVDSYITVKDCSVTGCTLKGFGSIGGIVGHAGANAATFTTIENCTITGNTLSSTDDGGWRVGVVVGTANNGQCVIKNITESNNTLSQVDKEAPEGEKRNYYGRFVPSGTGTLSIDDTKIQ